MANLNDLGLTPRQSDALDSALAATSTAEEIADVMKRFQKYAEENTVLARADSIRAGREPEDEDE